MLNREDVERIVENVINGLTLERSADFANTHEIVLKLNGREIDRLSIHEKITKV